MLQVSRRLAWAVNWQPSCRRKISFGVNAKVVLPVGLTISLNAGWFGKKQSAGVPIGVAEMVSTFQAVQAIKRTAKQLQQATKDLGDSGKYGQDPEGLIPRLVLAAYPDRVGVRQDERSNRLQLCGGVGAELAAPSGLLVPRGRTAARLLVAAQVQGLRGGAGRGQKVLVRAACQLDEEDLAAVCSWQAEVAPELSL